MTEPLIRYGIVGCGSMGREHIENIKTLDDAPRSLRLPTRMRQQPRGGTGADRRGRREPSTTTRTCWPSGGCATRW
jgi:hypothetical protein